jgi:predicted transcriptional regulator
MKTILMSIQPQHCMNIIDGKKTIELRTTAPKVWLDWFKNIGNLPEEIKVLIYCTKGRDLLRVVSCYNPIKKTRHSIYKIINLDYNTNDIANGKVVAEFTLNKIKEHKFNYIFENPETCEEELTYNFTTQEMKNAGFDYSWDFDEFLDYYGKEKTLYAWHISDLKNYHEPKELSEFGLKKAPQSWQYVKGGL